jgi:chitin disaccharide deacetylase
LAYHFGVTRVLFNCDDFGKTKEVNSAVIQAHREGVLGSASLMVTGDAFHEAVGLARAHPKLKVGLHLALSEAKTALPKDEIPDLVDENGCFRPSPAKAGIGMAICSQLKKQAAEEIRAQFEAFVSTGLPCEHVDGHHHLHMHPFVFEQCVRNAQEFGFKRIRLAREFGNPLPPRRDSNQFASKLIRHFTFKALALSAKKRLKKSSLVFFEGVLGLWETGRMSEGYLLQALPQLPAGNWEVYSHVGSEGCAEELPALLSDKVRQLLKDKQIQLI